MRFHLQGGSSLDLSVPHLHASLAAGLKSLIALVSAKYALLDVSIQRADGDFTIAATSNHARIKRDIAQLDAEIRAEIELAESALDQADDYNLLLRQCAENIANGTPILDADVDPTLAEAAMTIRRSVALGDPAGVAAETAEILRRNADECAAEIATAKDFVLQKLSGIARIAALNDAAQKWQSASIAASLPGAICSDDDRAAIDAEAKAAREKYEVLKSAYQAAYQKDYERAMPVLRSIPAHRLTRKNKSYGVRP
jgi:hypothetical protein